MDATYSGESLDIHIYYYHESVADMRDDADAYRLSRQLPSVRMGHVQERFALFSFLFIPKNNVSKLSCHFYSDLTRKTWHFFRFALSPTNVTRDNLQLCLDIYADSRHLTDTHLRCHRIQAPISCAAVRSCTLSHILIFILLLSLHFFTH